MSSGCSRCWSSPVRRRPSVGVPGRALLDPLSAAAFTVGLFALCARLRDDPPALGRHPRLRSALPLLRRGRRHAGRAVARRRGGAGSVPGRRGRPRPAAATDRRRGAPWRRRVATAALAAAVAALVSINGWPTPRLAARDDVPGAYADDVRRLFELLAAQTAAADVYVAPYVCTRRTSICCASRTACRMRELAAPGLRRRDETVRDRSSSANPCRSTG